MKKGATIFALTRWGLPPRLIGCLAQTSTAHVGRSLAGPSLSLFVCLAANLRFAFEHFISPLVLVEITNSQLTFKKYLCRFFFQMCTDLFLINQIKIYLEYFSYVEPYSLFVSMQMIDASTITQEQHMPTTT
jgi:hypothetical protein